MSSSSDAPTWLPPPATDPGASAPGSLGVVVVESRPILAPGTLVGTHYRIDGVIGSGAMGVVYRAHHLRLDRPVALKLARAIAHDHARLEREARAMARLSDPNVVAVYDVGTWDGDVYIAMELVEGMSLRAWLQLARRPWSEVLAVCLQAGRGLAAAHAAGLVHRDFKPDNVLVGADGRVRVADFGIARGIGPTIAGNGRARLGPDLTATGGVAGTPAYMAPEQFTGEADARSDLFAFCVVLYEALFAARPFVGGTIAELLFAIRGGRVRPLPRGHGVPEVVVQAMLAGLATDPRRRPPSMPALLSRLGGAAQPRRRVAVIAAIAIAAVLVLGAIAAWAGWGRSSLPRGVEEVEPGVLVVRELRIGGGDEPEETPAAEVERTAVEDEIAAPTPAIVEPPPTIAETPASPTPPGDAMIDPARLAGMSDARELALYLSMSGGDTADPLQDTEGKAFVEPVWDGKSHLVCKRGDALRVRGKTIDVPGIAITAMAGCRLELVDCDATADTVVQVLMRAEVRVHGGTMRPRMQLAQQMHGTLVVDGVEIVGDPPIGLSIADGRTLIEGSTIRGRTALRVSGGAHVRVTDSSLVGADAIDAGGTSRIELRDATTVGAIAGKVTTRDRAAVIEPAAAR